LVDRRRGLPCSKSAFLQTNLHELDEELVDLRLSYLAPEDIPFTSEVEDIDRGLQQNQILNFEQMSVL
jgi:hypothetical protein